MPSAPPASLFPRFPGTSPGPSGEAAPPPAPSFDHPSDATATAPGQAPTPAPGRVWWYVLYEELARRDAVINALAERVESLERESCRRQVPTFERRKYYE
ncbi:hypothetical protein AZH53_09860 [Methanomicrobiaceae archaeon CYW5]|uniref:hypothetical protein n=1 Tax=Methanovulcanius yangii TaxID=1789227 RepID=UPI0029CAA82D|nr:hypothetical protein [Methanovulcanius yangii]MBT8508709.1 hypothetical protein [Methanovulcanius yangii]